MAAPVIHGLKKRDLAKKRKEKREYRGSHHLGLVQLAGCLAAAM